MSQLERIVERCTVLVDMAEELCIRLYNSKMKFEEKEDKTLSCLFSKDLSSIRKHVEKNFPVSNNLTQVSGYKKLCDDCHDVAYNLSFFNDLVTDVVEFRQESLSVLRGISNPENCITEFDRNRPLILLFFELVTGYYRVLTLLGTVKEKKRVLGLYHAAHNIITKATNTNEVNIANDLFNALALGHRLFIDDFAPCTNFVGTMIVEFFGSIKAYKDTSSLRQKYEFNPAGDGRRITQPTHAKLNTFSEDSRSLHEELRDVPSYLDYVAMSFLVCPCLLFQEEKFKDIFKAAATDHLVVTLFRDININIHAEYESLYRSYPTKKDNVQLPRKFNTQQFLKEVATEAVEKVGFQHRERRSFILAEVTNLILTAKAMPGVLGPKFPVFVAASSMARAEILHYFRHQNLECRRDLERRLSDHSTDYYCPHIAFLIGKLHELSCLVEHHKDAVSKYYVQYLSHCDAPVLEGLCHQILDDCNEMQYSPPMKNIMASLPNCTRDVVAGQNLIAFRMNWDRCSTRLNNMNDSKCRQLCKIMNDVRHRSEYVDSLPGLMKRYFLPYDIYWYFDNALIVEEFETGFHLMANPLCFLPILSYVPLCVHRDFGTEAHILRDKVANSYDLFMNRLCTNYIKPLLDQLWNIFDELEKKTLAKEAFSRYENELTYKAPKDKSSKKKRNSKLPVIEDLPGCESVPLSSKRIAPLIEVREKLLNLIISAKEIGSILIYGQKHNIENEVEEFLTNHFSMKLRNITFHKDGYISRPSLLLNEIVTSGRVIQSLSNASSLNFHLILQTALHRNYHDGSTSQLGTALNTPSTIRSSEQVESPIRLIGEWFLKIVKDASEQNSGLMWIPSAKSFTRFDAKQCPIEAFINKNDMCCLCTVIGPNGVRCIDSMLLEFIKKEVEVMKDYIATNKSKLSHVLDGKADIAQVAHIEKSHSFLVASVKVGVALALREILHLGLRDSMQSYAPFAQSTLSSVVSSVSPWEKPDISTPLYSLAFDVGVIPDVDLSLKASLASVIHTDEDKENLALLNVAFASCFASSYWTQNSVFLPKLGAFRGNQHCLSLTMAKLIMCFADADPESGPFADALKSRANKFVELSANMILHMRSQGSKFDHHPVRAFTNILELFLRYCPLVDHYSLEKFLPYAFIHASQMEIAMGQVRGSDDISDGMNSVMNAESTTVN